MDCEQINPDEEEPLLGIPLAGVKRTVSQPTNQPTNQTHYSDVTFPSLYLSLSLNLG